MFKFVIADQDGIPVNIQTGVDGNECLVTDGARTLKAQWQSAGITTATTTTIAEAKPNESIMLTDILVILSKKVAGATIVVRFYDGTNTVILFTFDADTASFQFSHAFTGGLRGWKDADFQIVTNQATTVGVLVGYVHIAPEQTKEYGVWDAAR